MVIILKTVQLIFYYQVPKHKSSINARGQLIFKDFKKRRSLKQSHHLNKFLYVFQSTSALASLYLPIYNILK